MERENVNRVGRDFPIVCVGGSAGGLDAYIRLLQNLPNNMGVAIVIVNHMRTLATQLHNTLPPFTTMPVELITDSLRIQPNKIFIIPEQRDLHVFEGDFQLEPISKPRGWPDVITVFLRSLTEHWDGKLIAVIVSGYDGDGAEALQGIKEVGAQSTPTCLKLLSPAVLWISYSLPRRSQRPSSTLQMTRRCKDHFPGEKAVSRVEMATTVFQADKSIAPSLWLGQKSCPYFDR